MSTFNFPQIIFSTMFISMFVFESEKVNAFSVNLYQRDSFGSPFYNPKLSKRDIILRAIARSVNRSNVATLSNPTADLVTHEAQYLMKIRLGTPHVDVFATADTGSDLTWIQCLPSIRSIPQETPLFNPQASSSYARIACGHDKPCPPMSSSECEEDGFCHHKIQYSDGSYSKGLLSTDTLSMKSTTANEIVKISNYVFGCGTDNHVEAVGTSAVIGLGAGPQSLVTQLGSRSTGKFSYCLIPFHLRGRVSHIDFGPSANVHHPQSVVVPLANKHPHNLYYATLEAMTVGKTRIEFIGLSGTVEEGNVLIDSGTTISTLPYQFYVQIRLAVITQANARLVPHPHQPVLDLCFKDEPSLRLPDIVANFRGGDVPLKRYNAYVNLETVECLAFNVVEEKAIYGSWAQQDFIVGFDKVGGTVSFKSYDCANF